MKFRFWGTRGSVAVPGPDTLRFGGNTTCAELISQDNQRLIIDAGTGIRALGNKILKEKQPYTIQLFITHLHWDHLNGFPFFAPLYTKGVKVKVGGWRFAMDGISVLFDSTKDTGHFPVLLEEIAPSLAKSSFMSQKSFNLGSIKIETTFLNHPQGCLGLRFTENGKSIAFITDNELTEPGSISYNSTCKFCRDVDILIHDAQYLPEEMKIRRGYGHSDWRTVVDMAKDANVGRLILTHHDPDRTDLAIEALVNQAKNQAKDLFSVEAAYEGLLITT